MFKALVIDIETAPGIAYLFSTHKPYVDVEHIIRDTAISCFAACWAHAPREIIFHAVWQKGGRRRMLEAAHRLIEEADAIVHYNGVSFDMPYFNFEFAKNGLPVPAPKPQVDMLKTVNRCFRGLSHRLAFMGPALNIGKKVEHEGFKLWRAVDEGDKAAMRRMEHYCRGDVRLEYQLYHKLLPWFGAQHPNVSLWSPECGEKPLCTTCGSTRLHSKDFRRAGVFTYQRFRCQDCGSTVRGRHSIRTEAKPLTVPA